MILSDALYRRPDLCPEEDHDNEDIMLLPEELFIRFIDTDLQKEIAESTQLDIEATDTLRTIQEGNLQALKNDVEDWTLEVIDNIQLLFYKGKNYVPVNQDL